MLDLPGRASAAQLSSIPRILFQTVADPGAMPAEFAANVARLKELNPGWDHRLLGNAEIRDYLRQHLGRSDWLALEKLNPRYMVVLSDLFRYVALYQEGGVYLDIKSTATRPLDDVISPGWRFVISQWRNKLGEVYEGAGLYPELADVPGGEFQQWFLICEPQHPFLAGVIEAVLRNVRTYSPARHGVSKEGVLRVSGPICYTQAIWPLLKHFPWTPLDVTSIGFRYSIFEGTADKDRHQKLQYHYSQSREPIVLKDVYADPPRPGTLKLGDMLAREMQENTDLVLKLAVFSFVSTLTFVLLLLAIVVYFA